MQSTQSTSQLPALPSSQLPSFQASQPPGLPASQPPSSRPPIHLIQLNKLNKLK
ncbi:hypothetical protein D1AOALGA4SA_6966 [Olavius algarvensis Delta 1 endosymbiont]|nr:hypothetical protein D1AOALGA4SA_6966 [Olavius algarvensis Delta 1 endosymbiont]